MVKADGESDPDDPNKTQVILQLQPITTGYVMMQGVTSLFFVAVAVAQARMQTEIAVELISKPYDTTNKQE